MKINRFFFFFLVSSQSPRRWTFGPSMRFFAPQNQSHQVEKFCYILFLNKIEGLQMQEVGRYLLKFNDLLPYFKPQV